MAKFSVRDLEILSAYLDGEVSLAEKERIESRLAEDTDLQETFNQLQFTRSVIRSLPKLRSPRNYVLTPEMVGLVRESRQLFPVFRLAAALATVLLVFFLFGDFYLVRNPAAPARISMQSMQAGEQIYTTQVVESELFESQAPEAFIPEAIEEMPAEEGDRSLEPSLGEALPSEPLAEMEKDTPTGGPSSESESSDDLEEGIQAQLVPSMPTATEIPTAQEEEIPEEDLQVGFNYLQLIRVMELLLLLVIISTGIAAFYFYVRGK
jgi:hypothetical protein